MTPCPNCGKPITAANQKFCPYCGQSLLASQIAAAPSSLSVDASKQNVTGQTQATETPTAQIPPRENDYALIANEIRKMPPNVLASFSEVMNQLSKTNRLEVYLAIKKQIERINMIYDYGFFSVAEVFVASRLSPGDIAVYASPVRLQSKDIVLTCWPDKELGIRILHMEASSFSSEGIVEVKDIPSGRPFQTSIAYILGKLVHVIEFDTQAWRDILGQMAPVEFMIPRLKALQDWYQKSTNIPNKEQRIQELERRLAILSKGSVPH